MIDETRGVIRIAAVDDHEIVLRGILAVIEEHADEIETVALAHDVDTLLARITEVDIVLLDLHLSDGAPTDPDSVRRLVEHGMRVVVLTSEVRPVPIRRAIAAGAMGLVLKSDPVDRMVEAIRTVAEGNFAVSGELAHVLATDEQFAVQIAPRELEVLQLLAQGVPQKSIARQMIPELKTSTIREYLTRVANKYAAAGRPVVNAYGSVQEAVRDGHLEISDLGIRNEPLVDGDG